MRWVDLLLRIALTGVHQLMTVGWWVRRPNTLGAHAIALTPNRNLVLVKLRYASGWRVPGGGRSAAESPEGAVLRELREEIGMVSHGRVRHACDIAEKVDFKRDLASLLIVEDVCYDPPKWSWEVEQVAECGIDDLPTDLAAPTRRWIAIVREYL